MKKEIMDNLSRGAAAAEIVGDIYRAKAFTGAAGQLMALTLAQIKKVAAGELKIKGVGAGVIWRIDGVMSPRREHVREFATEERLLAKYDALLAITGVGPARATSWLKQGLNTPTAVARAATRGDIVLTEMQRLGLKYYYDLQQRIPRSEVSAVANEITKVIATADMLRIDIVGSWRRCKATSADVDLLVMADLAPSGGGLATEEFTKGAAAAIEAHDNFRGWFGRGAQKLGFCWMGKKGIVRQVDIFVLPPASYWAGLLYATGSAEHNIMIRGKLKALGYRLSQHGLMMQTGSGQWENVALENERAVYKLIGMDYVEPRDR